MDINDKHIHLRAHEATALQETERVYSIHAALQLHTTALLRSEEYARSGHDEAAEYTLSLAYKFGYIALGESYRATHQYSDGYEPLGRCPQLSENATLVRRGFRRHRSELFY